MLNNDKFELLFNTMNKKILTFDVFLCVLPCIHRFSGF